MKWKRLFLAIKLPAELKNQLEIYKKENLDPRIFRVVDNDNSHLTILFIGNTREDKIPLIKRIVSQITNQSSLTNIILTEISYGPHSKSPHLVWLKGDYNPALEQLRKEISKQLIRVGIHFPMKKERFIPHVTLARIRNYFPLPLPEKDKINQKLSFTFLPSSLWLIESQLSSQGAKYEDLVEFKF